MTKSQSSIERQIEIKASVAKVWEALTDSNLFGQWFNADCQSPFVAGKTTKAKNTSKSFTLLRVKESGLDAITASRRADERKHFTVLQSVGLVSASTANR